MERRKKIMIIFSIICFLLLISGGYLIVEKLYLFASILIALGVIILIMLVGHSVKDPNWLFLSALLVALTIVIFGFRACCTEHKRQYDNRPRHKHHGYRYSSNLMNNKENTQFNSIIQYPNYE